MRAMVLDSPGSPLHVAEVPIPEAGPKQVLLQVHACAVCRTDLHVVDSELPDPTLPLIPGHQIVGTVKRVGERADRFAAGDRVGVPWLGHTDGTCCYCLTGRENLCDAARYTGYQVDGLCRIHSGRPPLLLPNSGGVSRPRSCAAVVRGIDRLPLPESYRQRRAPWLLRLRGFRSHNRPGRLHQGRKIFAFTSHGRTETQRFALALGGAWAGGSDEHPPEELDAAIIFAPVGALVPVALRAVAKGGMVVCSSIHMSDIPSFPYEVLWGEHVVRSVANLTRRDGEEFLALALKVPVHKKVVAFPLEEANKGLKALREGKMRGAAVAGGGSAETVCSEETPSRYILFIQRSRYRRR